MAKAPTSGTTKGKPTVVKKPIAKVPVSAKKPAAAKPTAEPDRVAVRDTAAAKSNAGASKKPKSMARAPKNAGLTSSTTKATKTKPSALRALAADILNGTLVPTIDQIKALAAGFGVGQDKKAKSKKKKK